MNKCILFFNGWGLDENVVAQVKRENYNLFIVNYNTQPDYGLLRNYNEVFLIAWSLGVYNAENNFRNLPIIKKFIAINGTPLPIDNDYGINKQIFKLTMQSWNTENRFKFNRRMFYKDDIISIPEISDKDIFNQKLQLENIYKRNNFHKLIRWDLAVIGKNDLIFTEKNQFNYWKDRTKILQLQMPHYPFNKLNSWNQIIDLCS